MPAIATFEADTRAGSRPMPRTAKRANAEPIQVLLVEDELDSVRVIERRLRLYTGADFVVTHVPDLGAAFAALEERRFDAMLLDLGLPDGGGISTLGAACALARHLPILVLTGQMDEELSLAAVRAGAQDYLEKPVMEPRRIGRAIVHAVERHRRAALESGA